jgi:hypothetical protein
MSDSTIRSQSAATQTFFVRWRFDSGGVFITAEVPGFQLSMLDVIEEDDFIMLFQILPYVGYDLMNNARKAVDSDFTRQKKLRAIHAANVEKNALPILKILDRKQDMLNYWMDKKQYLFYSTFHVESVNLFKYRSNPDVRGSNYHRTIATVVWELQIRRYTNGCSINRSQQLCEVFEKILQEVEETPSTTSNVGGKSSRPKIPQITGRRHRIGISGGG